MTHCKRILVIDDEPDIREVARISLNIMRPWEVLTAASGAEGVRVATTHVLDAILLDMVMPELDGPATLAALKKNPVTQPVPVLLLTALTVSGVLGNGACREAQGVLSKPFDPGTLADQIESLLGWQPLETI